MSISWFKLHHELPDDIKLRRFTPQEKWAWVALLCLASRNSDRGKINADNDDIAEYCEFNCTQDWLYFRDKLIAKGMLEIDSDGNLAVLHWEDRQYEKPSARPEAVKARVAKHRAGKKAKETDKNNTPVTPSNAGVTPQIRSDQTREDPDQTRSDPRFARIDPDREGGENADESGEDPEGEARENSLRSTEPEPGPEPAAQNPSPGLANAENWPAHRNTGSGTNVPPPPAAPGFDPFARRGMPHVVPIQAQFQGPWGAGYTPELEAFEAWLAGHKAQGKTNPSGWIAAVVNGIANGGSRALWAEFKGQGVPAGEASSADPRRAIAAELRRLNRPGILPPEWQRRTQCQSVSQLSDADAQAYLAELQSQGVSA